ncbi:MAG: AMP-binding protein [Pseudomonadota bacterium]
MADLLAQFAASVARHPDRVAIVDGRGRETSFAALDVRARTLAARWQRQGIGPGDRVLLAMGITADLYASLAALWSLGATVVLPEPAMGLRGLRHAAKTTKPVGFCASGWFIALRFLVPALWGLRLLTPGASQGAATEHAITAGDVALISFTSGTTGPPKAIPRTHGFLQAQYQAVAPLLASDGEERDLVCFPVFTLINLAEGRTSVLPSWSMRRIDRLKALAVAQWLIQQRITRALVPPSIADLMGAMRGEIALHTVFTGGGPVYPDIVRRLADRLKVRVACVYGSTEAEPIAHLDADEISDTDLRDMQNGRGLLVGQPVPEARVRIVDAEVQVAGGHVNAAYLDPAQTAETKVREADTIWHRTGDAGVFDAAGRLWLLGRAGTQVETPNGPIYPFAVEVAARFWPGVAQSALMERDGVPVLVVQGDADKRADWEARAKAMGLSGIETVARIPMDRRHHSKVDRARLRKMLQG